MNFDPNNPTAHVPLEERYRTAEVDAINRDQLGEGLFDAIRTHNEEHLIDLGADPDEQNISHPNAALFIDHPPEPASGPAVEWTGEPPVMWDDEFPVMMTLNPEATHTADVVFPEAANIRPSYVEALSSNQRRHFTEYLTTRHAEVQARRARASREQETAARVERMAIESAERNRRAHPVERDFFGAIARGEMPTPDQEREMRNLNQRRRDRERNLRYDRDGVA